MSMVRHAEGYGADAAGKPASGRFGVLFPGFTTVFWLSLVSLLVVRRGDVSKAARDIPHFRLRRSHVASDQSLTGVAERYASALFELAKEQGQQAAVEKDLIGFQGLMTASEDLRHLITSPVFTAEAQSKAVALIAAKAGISVLTSNFLKVLAANRRLFAIGDIVKSYRAIAARARGEIAAEVSSAQPLTEAQMQALKEQLRGTVGKDVTITAKVDPSLLGGLIVKVGSKMIDSSLRTKLDSLKVAMKGTG
jgi:F-type H+-transporting ATPase subunit delta